MRKLASQRTVWDKIWRDKHNEVVIYQHPNIWLILWAGITFVSLMLPFGVASKILWWLALVFLAVWSGLEIYKGVNYFRKALGVLVLIFIVMAVMR